MSVFSQWLEKRIERIPFSTCWYWTKSTNGHGRPKATIGGKSYLVHRLVCQHFNGVLLAPMVRHTCDNILCVNPEHLIEGTHKDNMKDMTDRNRQAKHGKCGPSKLTKEQVIEIRRVYIPRHPEFGGEALSRKYNVSSTCINKIVRNKGWKL